MRTSFISFALFALSVPQVLSSEAHCSDADDADQAALAYTGADQIVVAGASTLFDTDEKAEELSLAANSSVSMMTHQYVIDCSDSTGFPDVCQNWCYYVFCKNGGVDATSPAWTVTVDRNANKRPESECGKYSPNKCSALVDRKSSPWPKNPVTEMDCDEQPKNTNTEGGAGAATRCMIRNKNRSEGARWHHFINNGPIYIGDHTQVLVVLNNHGGKDLCASLQNTGTTVCPAAVQPTDANVVAGTDDGIRQQ